MRNIFVLLILSMMLSGCPKKVVQYEDRDIGGLFDGRWIITSTRTSPIQKFGNWRMNCGPNEFRHTLNFVGGEAKITETQSAYIKPSGEFYFEVPTDVETTVLAQSELQMARKGITIIVKGQLDSIAGSGTGTLTAGVADLNNRGCTTQFVAQRIDG